MKKNYLKLPIALLLNELNNKNTYISNLSPIEQKIVENIFLYEHKQFKLINDGIYPYTTLGSFQNIIYYPSNKINIDLIIQEVELDMKTKEETSEDLDMVIEEEDVDMVIEEEDVDMETEINTKQDKKSLLITIIQSILYFERIEVINNFSNYTITNIIYSYPTLNIQLEEIIDSVYKNRVILKEKLKAQIKDYIKQKIYETQIKEKKEIEEKVKTEIVKEYPNFFISKSSDWLLNKINSYPNLMIQIDNLIDTLSFSDQNKQRMNLTNKIKNFIVLIS
jgi:hypothetical protein